MKQPVFFETDTAFINLSNVTAVIPDYEKHTITFIFEKGNGQVAKYTTKGGFLDSLQAIQKFVMNQ